MSDYRVFGKIAFNVLAEIKGKEFVLDGDFDKVRDWIMGKEDTDYDGLLSILGDKSSLNIIFPDQGHWCVIGKMVKRID